LAIPTAQVLTDSFKVLPKLTWISYLVSVHRKQAGQGLGYAIVQGRWPKSQPPNPMLLQVVDVTQFRGQWP
jgi:hypothetical protein